MKKKTAKPMKKIKGWGTLYLLSEPVVNKLDENLFEIQSYLLAEHISPAPLSEKEKQLILKNVYEGRLPLSEVNRLHNNCVNLIYATQSGNPLEPLSESTKRVIGARNVKEALKEFGYEVLEEAR